MSPPSPESATVDDPLGLLLARFESLDSDLQELSGTSTPDEAFRSVLSAAIRLTLAEASQTYRWDLDARAFLPGPSKGAIPEASPLAEHRQTVEWAMDRKSCVLLPAPGDQGLWVIPLVGLQSRIGVVFCWTRGSDGSQTALLTDLLNRSSQRICSILENLTIRFETGRLRDLFDNIIECIPHAIVAVDLKERVIEMNSNAEFIFGVRRFDALDEPLAGAFPAPLVTAFRSLALEALRSRTSRDVEVEHRLDERTVLTLGMTASTLSERSGEPRGVVYLCRDLRATRELERLRELDKMKSEFVHMISHELKTPLTAISGGVQLMRMDEAGLTADHKELLDLIEQGSQRLHQLVQEILAIARLEAGRIQLNREERDLARTIETVLKGLNIPVHLTIARDILKAPPKLSYDENKVKEILENLFSNAIKYSPKSGTVTVRFVRDGARLVLSVSDQGIGIPESEVGRIFDKFHRCENASASGIEGTGLGLAITKHLVELHGWEITVQSRLGQGTTFTMTIPIPRARKGADDAA